MPICNALVAIYFEHEHNKHRLTVIRVWTFRVTNTSFDQRKGVWVGTARSTRNSMHFCTKSSTKNEIRYRLCRKILPVWLPWNLGILYELFLNFCATQIWYDGTNLLGLTFRQFRRSKRPEKGSKLKIPCFSVSLYRKLAAQEGVRVTQRILLPAPYLR